MKKFCHLCGALYVEGKTQPWECQGCGSLVYENSLPAAEIILFDAKQRAVLAVRGINPNKGKVDGIGGFLEPNESNEKAVLRELREETGILPENIGPLTYVQSWTAKYPFSKEEHTVLSSTFTAQLNESVKISPHDDVAEIIYVSLEQLPTTDFSYPIYPDLIRKAHKLLFGD